MNLAEKLFTIKNSVKNLSPDKTGFGYTYVGPSKVNRTFNNLFEAHRILLTPTITGTKVDQFQSEVGEIVDGKGKIKKKSDIIHSIDMVFTFEDLDSGEKRTITWAGSGSNGAEQGFGSAITYGTRYFLMNYFGITVEKDDPDSLKKNNSTPTAKKTLKKMTAQQQKALILAIEKGNGSLVTNFLKEYAPSALKKVVEDKLKTK